MGFIDLESRARKDTFPGAYIKTFWAEKMMIARVTFAADTPVPLHSHPAEQAGVIIEGSYAMVIGDDAHQPVMAVGGLIGTLTIDQARRLVRIAKTARLTFSDDGSPRLIVAA